MSRRGRAALDLVRASHPEPILAVTAISGLLAWAVGRGWGTAWVVAAVLSGQLFVGWTNDYLDRNLDRQEERKDKPLATGAIRPTTVRNAAVTALILCLPLSLASGLVATAVHLGAIAAATAYNLGLKRTPLSPLPYAIAFSLLPAFVTVGLPGRPWPAPWTFAAGALLGSAAHFAQTLPDIERDVDHGVLGVPQLLGARLSTAAAGGLLGTGALVMGLGQRGGTPPIVLAVLGLTIALAAAIVVAGLSARRRLAFRLVMVAAALAVGGLVLSGSRLL
jgi:4-hydroxybenzoate polyprenyltransferase